jgi:hypothetical protein
MTVANAHAFLDQLKTGSATPELMAKIGTDFTKEHMSQALQERGTSKDDLLKVAAGGSATTDWIGATTAVASVAAAAA